MVGQLLESLAVLEQRQLEDVRLEVRPVLLDVALEGPLLEQVEDRILELPARLGGAAGPERLKTAHRERPRLRPRSQRLQHDLVEEGPHSVNLVGPHEVEAGLALRVFDRQVGVLE